MRTGTIRQARVASVRTPIMKAVRIRLYHLPAETSSELTMNAIDVKPWKLRQFDSPAQSFCLVTDPALAPLFTFSRDQAQKTMVVTLGPEDDLGQLLCRDTPDDADILIICRQSFLTSPDYSTIGKRRIVVMPCASTPVSIEQVGYFLHVAELTDPAAQARRAEEFFQSLSEASNVRIVDERLGAACQFDPFGGEYVWNQQAGPLLPGEQQIAPAGELSVLPMEIDEFDSSRALSLNGTLVLRGWPIVHAGYEPGLSAAQRNLYEKLLPLHRNPVLMHVRDGVITGCEDPARTVEGADLITAFDDLFSADSRYRTIWELGFGINTDMAVTPGNCGLNEPYGAGGGVVHFGLGLTPYTKFALTFICPGTSIVDGGGKVLMGRASHPENAQRIQPVRRAGCGCQ